MKTKSSNQPSTRPARWARKRRLQVRKAARRYRARLREEAQDGIVAARRSGVDPIWSDEPAAVAPPAAEPPAHEPASLPDPEEPEPAPRRGPYIRRAARGPKPEEPVPLADAHDPKTGRRRVRIVIGDKTIDGEVGGDSIEGWDFEN